MNSRPGVNSAPTVSNFGYEPCTYPESPKNRHLVVETKYISVDPYMRCRMNVDSGVDYAKAWGIGETISGFAVGRVLQSTNESYKKGDLVTSTDMSWQWKKFTVVHSESIRKIDGISEEQSSLTLGIFGLTGLTGAIGVMEQGNIQSDLFQTVVVSGAAGACGCVAGQVAKLLGCKKIIGICGTQEKCSFLEEDLKFNGAVCYKSENVKQRLAELCPDGVDVYFDNVGGNISDDVISHMNKCSTVILCGQISTYNSDVPYPPPLNQASAKLVHANSINRERFLVLSYANKFPSTLAFLSKAYAEGKLVSKETISHGLQNAGNAFVQMMSGYNIGKQIVKV
ncbi:unnamed protein product [Clavelina lepadiformis]|uniref:15-oxoprostaglandin 13-reductase n=1 Tax=Clavelina lepadiformis TaxID=159417 RepID=A0ABP0H0P8_CLALP